LTKRSDGITLKKPLILTIRLLFFLVAGEDGMISLWNKWPSGKSTSLMFLSLLDSIVVTKLYTFSKKNYYKGLIFNF
jgi:hypothetical protein